MNWSTRLLLILGGAGAYKVAEWLLDGEYVNAVIGVLILAGVSWLTSDDEDAEYREHMNYLFTKQQNDLHDLWVAKQDKQDVLPTFTGPVVPPVSSGYEWHGEDGG